MKNILFFLCIALFCVSCNFFDSLTLTNEDGVKKLEAIIAENLDTDADIYSLAFSADELTSEIRNIRYDYQLKGSYFNDTFDISSKTFSDPSKQHEFSYKYKKAFKMKEAPVSLIATKYQEALEILKTLELFKEDQEYHLDYWVFRTDKKGNIYADFDLNYFINSTSSGRMRTTNYGQYKFTMNPDKTLKLETK
ncbi:hypothetical protein ACWGOQ_0016380 [Aquimarina sp. M1]